MNREEAIKHLETYSTTNGSGQTTQAQHEEAKRMAIKALEQEPSDTVSRGAFEQVMWERDVAIGQLKELGYELGQKIEPCDDLISREAALEKMADYVASGYADSTEDFEEYSRIICQLPPVTQKSETGHWINLEKKYKGQVLPFWGRYGCSKCGGYGEGTFNYCPNCGCRMQESEEA